MFTYTCMKIENGGWDTVLNNGPFLLYEGREAIKVVKSKVAWMPLQNKLSVPSSKYPEGTRRVERPSKVCKIASKEICECLEQTYGSRLP
jgi:hypothetical protein